MFFDCMVVCGYMKNIFVVIMMLLLVLIIGGFIVGYNIVIKLYYEEVVVYGEGKGIEKGIDVIISGVVGSKDSIVEISQENMIIQSVEVGVQDGEFNFEVNINVSMVIDGVNNVGSISNGNDNEFGIIGNIFENMVVVQFDINKVSVSGDVDVGKEKFVGICVGCYGVNVEGGVGLVLNIVKDWSFEDFIIVLCQGCVFNKIFSLVMFCFVVIQVSDQDIFNIYEYFKGF